MYANPNLERALVLLETKRFADAEQHLKSSLAQNPEDPRSLALLALCQLQLDKKTEALTAAQQAVGLAPDDPFVRTTLGRALLYNNQPEAARQALKSALETDPTHADAYAVLSQLDYHERRWDMALHNAEKGLEHDPEDQTLLNLRAMALVKLNRSAEAADTTDYALHNDPEDSFAHSNKGWVKLEQGHYDEAAAAFREALRFDPNNEHAREGLKEAIKGKNWLYRGILRYFLFMGKLSERNQWIVIIGLYLGMRLLRTLARENSNLQPFIAPILLLYLVFVFATWIGQPLSNLVLRLHPVGKFALSDDEKRFSNIVGAFVAAGLLLLAGSYFMPPALQLDGSLLGISLLAMLIPVGGAAGAPEGSQARRWLGIYALALLACGPLVVLLSMLIGREASSNGPFLAIFGLGIFLYGWVANFVMAREARRY
jgi:tetratricopeptide (TPR) repeat protein